MIQLVAAAGLCLWWGIGRTVRPRVGLVPETKRIGDSEFVLVSFWGGVIVVDYRHACVDEEQGEGGQAGRENDA